MSYHPDIFGLAFRDYLDGQTDENIIVNIDFGEPEVLPVSYFFRPFTMMPFYERKVLRVCTGKVLDVGAGAGSHGLYLQKKGLDVTAIDISQGGVECMKRRGMNNAVKADILKFKDGTYDTILFLMNGIGMAQTLSKLYSLLQHVSALLSSGGNIFIESTDLAYLYEEDDGSVMINLAAKYYGETTYRLTYKGISGKPFPWLFVDFDNLCNISARAGLKCEMFYRGKTGNYIAVLHKNG